ncbi:MAG: hypothetical protein EWV50_16965 [Microcystis aeruginosa Ma_MB_F_20061100_S20]|uniref:Uncharacterized protein n=1 Tax=Microcystis aeruginosa Ma_MB_F_20061100_S20D TaxID=2486253 RepID=A0A552EKA0_MICAE|nr:MAG: hypothetical protein EWV78_12740 [Microcystis aeruginosa Ma_MB_F_20061100_S20D]TRU35425.1 MAG: hypothetical protein EWV50_16965 [Microcystis aeruginosa Ma_MB_F_20061100_S20]
MQEVYCIPIFRYFYGLSLRDELWTVLALPLPVPEFPQTRDFLHNKGVLVPANTPLPIISGGLVLPQKSTTAQPTAGDGQG